MTNIDSVPGDPRPQSDSPRPASALQPDQLAFLEQLDHDLRTPLGTMAAALDLLRAEWPGTAAHAEAFAVLERQITRLHSLTQSLREFSQRVGP